jgi:acylphosphatase
VKRAKITITGVVQGVYYRASARNKAVELNLAGWVRNLNNGAVLAEAEGPAVAVEQFITWCYQGPENAIVTGVEIEYLPPLGEQVFDIR